MGLFMYAAIYIGSLVFWSLVTVIHYTRPEALRRKMSEHDGGLGRHFLDCKIFILE